MGGILGRKIKVIKEDGASDWPTFAEKSKKLLINDRCAAVFGCWTSASRKAVLPVFEKENGLLYYPTFYEGLEQSKNVIYTGQEATQQILYSLDWAKTEKKAKSFFLIGSDYIWPRTSMKIARKHIENFQKGKVVGEEYYPLGSTNFGSLMNKIKLQKPDCIFAAVVGGSNVAFYKALKAAGITGDKQLLVTLSVTEDEMTGVGGENFQGFYSSMKYFQSLDNENNKKFVAAFKAKYGKDSVIGDVTQAGYLGPWLWKAAVEKAKSFDVDKVVAASRNRHRAQDGARRLREARPEPPPVEQVAHRHGHAGRDLQGGGRVTRLDQARSVPQRLSISPLPPRCMPALRRVSFLPWRSGHEFQRPAQHRPDAGLCRPEPVRRAAAHGPGAGHHLRADGRDQHGAWRVHDHRRLHHLPGLHAGELDQPGRRGGVLSLGHRGRFRLSPLPPAGWWNGR